MARLRFAGKGTIQGKKYQLRGYPAVVAQEGGRVSGDVFTLPEDRETLQRLDEYEEYDRSAPEKSLFRRYRVTVTFVDGGETECWVYFYNLALPSH